MTSVLFEESGKVGHIIFNRPEKLNAINDALQKEVIGICENLKERKDLSVIIVSGKGSSFMAGADLEVFAMFRDNPEGIKTFMQHGNKLAQGLYSLPQYTISAVEGSAVGGGYEFALYTNYIIAGKDAKFGLPETLLGLLPGLGGAHLLEKRIGAKGLKMAITGEIISAEEAYKLGLIDEISESKTSLEKAFQLADQIIKNPTFTTHILKKHFLHFNPLNIETVLNDFQHLLTEPESQKRIQAFLSRIKE